MNNLELNCTIYFESSEYDLEDNKCFKLAVERLKHLEIFVDFYTKSISSSWNIKNFYQIVTSFNIYIKPFVNDEEYYNTMYDFDVINHQYNIDTTNIFTKQQFLKFFSILHFGCNTYIPFYSECITWNGDEIDDFYFFDLSNKESYTFLIKKLLSKEFNNIRNKYRNKTNTIYEPIIQDFINKNSKIFSHKLNTYENIKKGTMREITIL